MKDCGSGEGLLAASAGPCVRVCVALASGPCVVPHMGFVRGLLVFALLKRTTSTPAPSVTCSDVWETHGG